MTIEPIVIDTPATIRSYTSGGKGGFGSSSSPLHRLVERRWDGDITACGVFMGGQTKISVTDGAPKKAAAAKYGTCPKCWHD